MSFDAVPDAASDAASNPGPDPVFNSGFDPGPRLESWKQVAAHVGRDARTAQRWEKTEGLPVHRHRHAKRDTVFAYPSELDAWLQRRTGQPAEGSEALQPAVSSVGQGPVSVRTPGHVPVHVPAGVPASVLGQARLRAWALVGFAVLTMLLWGVLLLRGGEEVVDASEPAVEDAVRLAGESGRLLLHQGGERGIRAALERFEDAVARAPRFAGAHAGLATAVAFTGRYGLVPAREAFPRARAAAERALELDPDDAEAHAALALVAFYHDHDLRAAAGAFGRALRLDPERALTHHAYAHFLSCLGLHEAAVQAAQRARDLEPLSSLIAVDTAWLLFRARDFEAALVECRRALALEPGQPSAVSCLAESFEQLGDSEAAWETLRTHGALEAFENGRASLEALAPERALQELRRLRREALERRARTQWVSGHARVFSLIGLGRDDELLDELERALEERDRVVVLTRVHPLFDGLRDHPRFRAVVEAVGFPSDAAQAEELLADGSGPE